MRNKSKIMGIAALLILIFHFYLPLTSLKLEKQLVSIAYIGVDMFFFVSAYSLGKSKIDSYFSFIKKRFSKVYFKFLIFVLLAMVFLGYNLSRALKILIGIEFFNRGGGSFLWFVIAILITYLLIPFMRKLKDKYGLKAFVMMMLMWLLLSIVLEYVLSYKTIFIYINRLPIIFLGFFYDEFRFKDKRLRYIFDVITLIIGTYILIRYGSFVRLNKPFTDMYYVLAIPLVYSLIDLMDNIDLIIDKCLAFIGTITLELYGLQMIFGYKIENIFIEVIPLKILIFPLTAISLIIIAYIFNKSYMFMERKILK